MLKAMSNREEEGKAWMEGGGHDKIQYEYTKINTLFMAKWPKSIPYL